MRRTKEDSEKTREAILDAAVNKFCKNGVAITTLSEIASEANVTRGAIYWHFKDKMDIFDALHERVYKFLHDMLQREIEHDYPDPLHRLQEICKYLLENIETDLSLKHALSLFWVINDYDKEWASFREKHYSRKNKSMDLFLFYFKKTCEKGMLSDGADVQILSLSLFCFMRGIIIAHIKDPELFDLKKEGMLMVEQFFSGLGSKN
jgi:AcrR family transcriptional regulator